MDLCWWCAEGVRMYYLDMITYKQPAKCGPVNVDGDGREVPNG